MIYRTESEARQHIEQLFEVEEMQPPDGSLPGLVANYNGERLLGLRKPNYDRLANKQISPTDPDATPMRPSGGRSVVLGYRDHYGGKPRISSRFCRQCGTNPLISGLILWRCGAKNIYHDQL